jgi:hypothetical protein
MAQPTDVPIWNGDGANRSTPSVGKQALGYEPNEDPSSSIANYNLFWTGQWLLWLAASTGENLDDTGRGIFGDGSDGDVVISGGTTTLTRTMYYDDLTIESDGVLATAGFPVYVKGVCQIDAGGVMHRNGVDGGDSAGAGAGGDAAAALSGGILGGSGGGGAGVDSGTGLNGSAVSDALGGRGSEGGEGNEANGGTGGTATDPAATDGGWKHVSTYPGYIVGPSGFTRILGGGGGGGGSEGVVAAGGGGGSGGGVLALYAFDLRNNGTIQANGGRGGSASGGSAGAGGGGGGGVVFVVYRRKSGAGTIEASTTPGTAGEVIELTA